MTVKGLITIKYFNLKHSLTDSHIILVFTCSVCTVTIVANLTTWCHEKPLAVVGIFTLCITVTWFGFLCAAKDQKAPPSLDQMLPQVSLHDAASLSRRLPFCSGFSWSWLDPLSPIHCPHSDMCALRLAWLWGNTSTRGHCCVQS